tara:strand:+ start:66 stop:1598 length:1533 start_codon:yes stop_codon:yes gene_type:complete
MKFFDFLKNKEKWLKYYEDLKSFFSNRFLTDAIIPYDLINVASSIINKKSEEQIFRFIIGCSIVIGILVAIPGDIGVGLYVAQALEFTMAVNIARLVGLDFKKENVFKLLGVVGISSLAVLYAFEKVLQVIFKLVSHLPAITPASFVSVVITNLFLGIFCYLAFTEIKNSGEKKLKISSVGKIATNASTFTYKIGKSLMTLLLKDMPGLFNQIKENVHSFIQLNIDYKKKVKGEVFFAASMAYLLDGRTGSFEGPISQMWLDAWRMSFTSKLSPNASIDEIRTLAQSYNIEQLPGVDNLVQSKFYEILESNYENMDEDYWSAELFTDPSHPATDVRFYNSKTNQTYEVNYKLTDDTNYIEHHLAKYPDKPVITSPEVAEKMNNPLVSGGKYHTDEVIKLSDKNFDALLSSEHDIYLQEGAATAGIIVLSLHLFPFFVAYSKGRINKNQFESAVKKFVPEITTKTLNRIIMLTLMGPIFGWFLLASFILKVSTHESDNTKKIKQLIYKPLV